MHNLFFYKCFKVLPKVTRSQREEGRLHCSRRCGWSKARTKKTQTKEISPTLELKLIGNLSNIDKIHKTKWVVANKHNPTKPPTRIRDIPSPRNAYYIRL